MDVPFYEDEIMPIDSSTEKTMYDKTALKLDFTTTGTRRQNSENAFDNSILTSPDLNLLKLASPELEKLIIANCNVLTTPTPQGLKTSNLTVTEQQELYARGFLEALQKLHEQQGPPSSVVSAFPQSQTTNQTCSSMDISSARPMYTQSVFPMMSTAPATVIPTNVPCTQGLTAPTYSTNTLSTISTQALPLECIANDNVASQIFPEFQAPGVMVSMAQQLQTGATNYTFATQGRFGELKAEEQVVPGTPPLPPIDLDLQEAVKNERKKLRNRLAASKCRKRKLEREAELQEKVDVLKSKNSKLVTEAQELRKMVCELKQQVMSHVSGGCQVYLTPAKTVNTSVQASA